MSLGCSLNIMHIILSVSSVILLPFLILDIVAWLNIFSFLILVLVYPLLDSSLSTSILYLINVFQSSFLYYIFILLWYFKTFSKSTNKNILFSLILVLTYTDISAIIMTSRKARNKIKRRSLLQRTNRHQSNGGTMIWENSKSQQQTKNTLKAL